MFSRWTKKQMVSCIKNISSICFYIGSLVLQISAQQIPTRFTFPLNSPSVNGSSATGNCTGATRLSHRYQCDDPTSSVLYDGHIPTLTGLEGNMWASQLLTINASSAVLVFDFTWTPNFQVMRVEMVVFNCPQWGISVQSVTLTNSDLSQLIGAVNPTLSSCDYLVRFCIPKLSITSSQAVLRLEFATLEPTDWIHIAEVGFYGNSQTCPPEIFIPEPTRTTEPTTATSVITSVTTSTTTAITSATTTPTSATTTPTSTTTTPTSATTTPTSTTTTPTSATTTPSSATTATFSTTTTPTSTTTINTIATTKGVSPQDNSVKVAAGVASGVLFFIMTIIIASIIAITCIKRRRGKVCFQSKLKEKFRNESHHNRSGLALTPVNQEETYSQLSETGQNMPLHAHDDEAYDEAYSQLEHTGRLGAGNLPSSSKADDHLTQMYAVVNKPKQHTPFLQPTQPLEQEYAVVDKHRKQHKSPLQPTQPSEQEYAVVDKDSKRLKPPSQPTQPSEQEYAVINKNSKRCKPPSQPTQPSEQEYAVVNKDSKRRKPPTQPAHPSEQEYAVVNKNSKRRKPPSQPAQPPVQEYAVVNKHHPPAKSEDLVEDLKEDETANSYSQNNIEELSLQVI